MKFAWGSLEQGLGIKVGNVVRHKDVRPRGIKLVQAYQLDFVPASGRQGGSGPCPPNTEN